MLALFHSGWDVAWYRACLVALHYTQLGLNDSIESEWTTDCIYKISLCTKHFQWRQTGNKTGRFLCCCWVFVFLFFEQWDWIAKVTLWLKLKSENNCTFEQILLLFCFNACKNHKWMSNKSRVYNTKNATGFGFSTLMLPETSCLFFLFSQPFCIEV